MARKVLTWSNSQLNNSRYNFHVPCLRSSSYVPCFFSSCTCIQSKFTSVVKDVAFVLIYI